MQPSSDDGGALRIEVYRQHFFVALVNSGPTLLTVLIITCSPLSVPLPCLFPFEHVNRHPCFFSPSLSENSRPTERQRMYHNTLRKAHTKDHKTILARFLNDRLYRDSQIKIGWDENTCIAYDEIAREDHSYAVTRWERSGNENSWKLVLNSEGANGPVDQRYDYQEAEETCDKSYRKYAATAGCGNTGIHPQEQVRQRPDQQLEGHEGHSH